MTDFTTLPDMIARQPADAIAVTSPSGVPLSYGALNALIARTTSNSTRVKPPRRKDAERGIEKFVFMVVLPVSFRAGGRSA